MLNLNRNLGKGPAGAMLLAALAIAGLLVFWQASCEKLAAQGQAPTVKGKPLPPKLLAKPLNELSIEEVEAAVKDARYPGGYRYAYTHTPNGVMDPIFIDEFEAANIETIGTVVNLHSDRYVVVNDGKGTFLNKQFSQLKSEYEAKVRAMVENNRLRSPVSK